VSGRRALWLAVIAALAARLALMLARGDYLVYDEGYYLLLARSLRHAHAFTLNGLPHVALSPLQPLVVALISSLGVNDLWTSRLLAVVAGALLVLPVHALASRIGGPRAGLAAAGLTALAPGLMTFVPFFPGRTWNLYFGSEPLFLLLLFLAAASAARAAESRASRWFVLIGLLGAGAFLTRAEGIVAAPLTFAVLAWRLWRSGNLRGTWKRLVAGAALGVLVCTPYLAFLRVTLGRWAFSGRVQGAAVGQGPAPSTREAAQQGGAVLEEFVWGGNLRAFVRAQYALTPDGTHMQSQYWGVVREPGPARASGTPADTTPRILPAAPEAPPAPAPQRGSVSFPRALVRGVGVVVPLWLLALALVGFALRPSGEGLWLAPPLLAALLPVLAAYVEPRVLLPLAPIAAIGAALLWQKAEGWLATRRAPRALAAVALAAVTFAYALPAARDGWEASHGVTPLQQVGRAQRAVGLALRGRLPAGAPIMSWHPALAIYADRDWRVLPEEPWSRVLPYALRERVSAIVASRFYPSPLGDLPRAFTAVLLEPGDRSAGTVRLEPLEDTPLLFVGRLARSTQ